MSIVRKDIIAKYPVATIEEIAALIRQKEDHINLEELITPYNGSAERQEHVKKQWWAVNYTGTLDAHKRAMFKLRDKLLEIGGCEVVLPENEPDFTNIMAHGQLWDNIATRKVRGAVSRCHANAAALWADKNGSYKDGQAVIICTGYALSDDGFWRQHSWVMYARPRTNVLYETTVPRLAYFGFGLTFDMADKFWDNNPLH